MWASPCFRIGRRVLLGRRSSYVGTVLCTEPMCAVSRIDIDRMCSWSDIAKIVNVIVSIELSRFAEIRAGLWAGDLT